MPIGEGEQIVLKKVTVLRSQGVEKHLVEKSMN